MNFRTISGEYLIAMKLMAGRPYKHDLSDVAEIFAEHRRTEKTLSKEAIITAINNLYDSIDKIPESSMIFLDKIYQCDDIDQLILEQKENEKRAKETLITFEENYQDVLSEDILLGELEIMYPDRLN